MKRVILALLALGISLNVACSDESEGNNHQQDPDAGDAKNVDIDMGGADDGTDLPVDMDEANNLPGDYEITTVEIDADAPIQVIDGTTQFVTFPNAAGSVSIWDAATGESQEVATTAPGPGLMWSNPDTGEYVVAASSGNSVILNASGLEGDDFSTFGGPLAHVWLPPKGSDVGYASRPDGSLAMINFVEKTALILDAAFGESGEVLDIEPGTGRALYRRTENPEELWLFDPALKSKSPAPKADFAAFVGDGVHIFLSNEADGTRFYDPVGEVLQMIAPQPTSTFEVHKRFVVVQWPDRNDLLFDLQEQKSILVGTTITVPPNPWSPEDRFFVLSGRGPAVVDTMTGLVQTVAGTGKVEQVEFSSDNTRMSLVYSAFRPRLVVFDLVDGRTLYTDEVVRITDEDPMTPDIVTPLTMDKSGRWIAYFDTIPEGAAISVYDSVDDALWSINDNAPITRCGLSMSDDGSALLFPSFNAAGDLVMGSWAPGAEQAQGVASNILFMEDCAAPVATANHESILIIEATPSSQRVVLLRGAQKSVVADGFTVTSLKPNADFSVIDLTYDTVTGTRATQAMARYTTSDNNLNLIDTQALRIQGTISNEEGLAYRFVPEGCTDECIIGIRAYLYGDDAPHTLSDLGGRVRALIGPHVLFQGGRRAAGNEIVTELQLGRRLKP